MFPFQCTNECKRTFGKKATGVVPCYNLRRFKRGVTCTDMFNELVFREAGVAILLNATQKCSEIEREEATGATVAFAQSVCVNVPGQCCSLQMETVCGRETVEESALDLG